MTGDNIDTDQLPSVKARLLELRGNSSQRNAPPTLHKRPPPPPPTRSHQPEESHPAQPALPARPPLPQRHATAPPSRGGLVPPPVVPPRAPTTSRITSTGRILKPKSPDPALPITPRSLPPPSIPSTPSTHSSSARSTSSGTSISRSPTSPLPKPARSLPPPPPVRSLPPPLPAKKAPPPLPTRKLPNTEPPPRRLPPPPALNVYPVPAERRSPVVEQKPPPALPERRPSGTYQPQTGDKVRDEMIGIEKKVDSFLNKAITSFNSRNNPHHNFTIPKIVRKDYGEAPPPPPPSLPARRPSSSHAPNTPSPMPQEQSVPLNDNPQDQAWPGRESNCLKCRDFSGPDNHAAQAQFMREHHTSISHLAKLLTEPFEDTTDKFRALFTWFHYNVEYDTHGFFNSCVGKQDPDSILRTGRSVCQGYAALYQAMARSVGLQCELVSGHGKGYGYQAGKPIAYPPTGHAWNAILLPTGYHLIDACWGAGALVNNEYKAIFSPHEFTNTPAEFTRTHYPSDQQFNLAHVSWEEYTAHQSKHAQRYDGVPEVSYLGRKLYPQDAYLTQGYHTFRIMVGGCKHASPPKDQDTYCLFLDVGREFKDLQFKPLQKRHFDDGWAWAVDASVEEGQKMAVHVVRTWDNRDAKGLRGDEFVNGLGRKAFSVGTVAVWEP